EQEIRKGISSFGCAAGILRFGAGKVEKASVSGAVISKPLIVAEQNSELHRLPTLQQREVIGGLKNTAVLRLGPLIKGRSLQCRITAPRIVGERASRESRPSWPRQSRKALNIVRGVEVIPF